LRNKGLQLSENRPAFQKSGNNNAPPMALKSTLVAYKKGQKDSTPEEQTTFEEST